MSTRTDVHRPSTINPDDYEFVGFEYLPRSGDALGDSAVIIAERMRIRAHMERTGETYSRHQHGGNCHVCGAAAVYTALFYHRPTASYIRTGLECAEKLECADTERFRTAVADARKHRAGKQKAQAILHDVGLDAAWAIYVDHNAAAAEYRRRVEAHEQSVNVPRPVFKLPREEAAVLDIVGRLVQHGRVTDAQVAYLRKLVDQISRRAEIEAQRRAESNAAQPVPVTAQRIVISGEVLSTRDCETDFGRVVEMLVRAEGGWKVWGTVPAGLVVERGSRVEFTARIEPARDDPKFGFFSRPSKARLLAPQ